MGVPVVGDIFEQGLSHVLHETTINLGLRESWVDDGADIVDEIVAVDPHIAGIGADLDYCDMAVAKPAGA